MSDGQNTLVHLEDMHSKLKGVTGVSDNNEIERLFIQLDQSTTSLRRLIEETEMRPELLWSQNANLRKVFQDLRSIGNAKMEE